MFGRYIQPSAGLKLALLIMLSGVFSELQGQYYNIRCSNIGRPEGLWDGHINDIIQDQFDYIWIATQRGLYRHDGLSVANFPIPGDSGELFYDKRIIDLGNAVGGGIWIVSQNGLTLFDNGIFRDMQISSGQGLVINSAGIINNQDWFFTRQGIYRYHQEEQALEKIMFSPQTNFKYSFLNDADLTTGLLDPNTGELWICSASKGIYVKDPETDAIRTFLLKPGESQSANNIFVNKMLMDSEGGIWFASPEGLWYKAAGSEEAKRIDFHNTTYMNNEVSYIEQDKDGRLWCSVEDMGLIVLNGTGEVVEHFDAEDYNSSGLSSGFINKIFIDSQDNIWVGHKETGIDYFTTHYSQKIHYYKNVIDEMGYLPNTVKRIEPLDTDRMLLVYESPNNPNISGLSIISTGRGSYFSRPSEIQKLNVKQTDLNFTELFKVNDQYAVSTYDNLYRFDAGQLDRKSDIIDINTESQAYSDYVMFHYLQNDTLWLLGQNLRIFQIPDNTESVIIEDINLDRFIIDEHSLMWGAASYSGLLIIDLQEKVKLAQFFNDPLDDSSLSDNTINCIHKDSNGHIWIGTQFGLNRVVQTSDSMSASSHGSDLSGALSNLKFQRFTVEDGLNGNAIKSILEDGQKRLWMSTDNGISVVDLMDYKIYRLDYSDGIQQGSFHVGSSARSENGTMYFGGENGLNFFHPDSILFNLEAPSIHINEFYLLGEKVEPGSLHGDEMVLEQMLEKTEHISLSNKENLVSFGFVAVDFTQSDEMTYYHMLDGFDMEWIRSADDNRASYTKLPAGTYTFRVKARTKNNQWTKEASIQLTVYPPFWASWWFILLIGMAFFSLVFLYFRVRLNSLKRQKVKLEEIVHKRTEELEQANAMKIRFFTNISHEIRTPLTLILAPIEHLLNSKGIARSVQKKHALIYRNAQRLHELINQLLQFRKIETGNLEYKPSYGEPIQFIEDLAAPFFDYASQKGQNFILDIQAEKMETWFDEDKLDKILTNLLSNAIKYTPKEGKIILKVSTEFENSEMHPILKLEVSDTGIGIDQAKLERIFDRFYEVEDVNLIMEGTGIGLALTKALVELYKGKISVKSKVGEGSCFSVWLPMGGSYVEEFGRNEEGTEGMGKFSMKNLDSEKGEGSVNVEAYGNEEEKATILIVEDNMDLCSFIQDLLNSDYHVQVAYNGREAMDLLAMDHRVDLVITDIMMPVMDGLTFCRQLKNNIDTSHIPVLLLTAKHGEESELEGLKCGADDYINKPFNEEILKVKIKNVLVFRENLKLNYLNQLKIEPSDITASSRDKDFIEKAIRVVEESISNSDFDIKTFASKMAVSPSTMLRKMKAITGESSDKFIRTLRLKRAAQLLQSSQLTVTEICYEVGFSSQKHFSATFKKQFGLSPSEYKKRYSEVI
jgi:signal transduction histidine kinase/DNA-binding response OmpR family regulator/ligand-binding sensor domain-containing protein